MTSFLFQRLFFPFSLDFFFFLSKDFFKSIAHSLMTASGLREGASLVAERRPLVLQGSVSGGSQAWLLCGTWHLPGQEIEPVSPGSAGSFLTAGPPAKSSLWVFRDCKMLRDSHKFKSLGETSLGEVSKVP